MSIPTFRIAVLPGDGIGPEVIGAGLDVLRAIGGQLRDVAFSFDEISVGAGEYKKSGDPLPAAALARMKEADAILLGAMGCPTYAGRTASR